MVLTADNDFCIYLHCSSGNQGSAHHLQPLIFYATHSSTDYRLFGNRHWVDAAGLPQSWRQDCVQHRSAANVRTTVGFGNPRHSSRTSSYGQAGTTEYAKWAASLVPGWSRRAGMARRAGSSLPVLIVPTSMWRLPMADCAIGAAAPSSWSIALGRFHFPVAHFPVLP